MIGSSELHRVTTDPTAGHSCTTPSWVPACSTCGVSTPRDPPPERLEVAGVGARLPAISGKRLAFGRWLWDQDIARLAPGRPREVFLASSFWEGSSQCSPDGRRIAFDSQGEDGRWDIWTIDAEGGVPHRLTLHPGDENIPSWSRDGRCVYFNAGGCEAITSSHAGGPARAGRPPEMRGPARPAGGACPWSGSASPGSPPRS